MINFPITYDKRSPIIQSILKRIDAEATTDIGIIGDNNFKTIISLTPSPPGAPGDMNPINQEKDIMENKTNKLILIENIENKM